MSVRAWSAASRSSARLGSSSGSGTLPSALSALPAVSIAPTNRSRERSAVFDLRSLKGTVVKQERPEREAPGFERESNAPGSGLGAKPASGVTPNAPAPSPDASFDGLDFANWGAGHPPDTNGDVGPTYYIQTINTSIGVYRKSDGVRVAACRCCAWNG